MKRDVGQVLLFICASFIHNIFPNKGHCATFGCGVCLPFLSSSGQNDPSIHPRDDIKAECYSRYILQDSCLRVGPIYSYLNHDVARCGPMAAEVYQVGVLQI